MRLTAAARRGGMTPALPMPYPALEAAGLRLRRGQVSLTVAAPGVGKSMIWLNLAVRMNVPTLYWSADTDQHDVMMRALGMLTNFTTEEVDRGYKDDGAKTKQFYDDALATVSVDWVFDSAIPALRVAERIAAFAEMRGEYPQLVVLDNLSNAVEHQDQERQEQAEFIMEMKRLAQTTRAHVAMLAHAKGEYENGTRPIPQGGVLNNISKVPEIMLSLHRASADGKKLGVNIVKNRGGKADPAAIRAIELNVDYARAFVGGAT